jgi:hypothetical protein
VSERHGRQRERKRDVPVVRTDGFHLPVFRRRAAVYVDGFNLYHAIDALDRDYLKWLDLGALARTVAPRSQVIRRLTWCTAFRPSARHEVARHQAYHDALKARGVNCLTGHFVIYSDGCNACGHMWTVGEEKQSDVNLALSVLDDAHENRFDVCYLVTTDGDHAATARFLKERFPQKRLVIVTPPGRRANRTLLEFADAQAEITIPQLERSLLPPVVDGPDGPILRPSVYDPPEVPKQRGHLTLVASNGD